MIKEAIFHIPEVPYAYGISSSTLLIKIRVAKKDVKYVKIYCKDRYDFLEEFPSYYMKKTYSGSLYDYFTVEVKESEKRFRYFFEICSLDSEIVYYNEAGFWDEKPGLKNSFQFPYLLENLIYKEVPWMKESVCYSIFPERFFNGNRENDNLKIQNWGDNVRYDSFFGGDINGIEEKIPYLKKLGVNFIYLTPIFKSESNHKYNTKEYFKLDEHFGDEKELKNFLSKAHRNGMKVILDGVFNHVGRDFFAFEDAIQNGEKSKYKDWFYIDEYPVDIKKVNYETFGNRLSYMPKINLSCKEARNYFIGVGLYWIKKFKIDGWRLDVCDELDHKFIKEFREKIKDEKDDAIIIGEIMHKGESFLKGDELDSTMNYPFRVAALDFFAKKVIDARKFNDILEDRRANLIHKISLQMLNLLDSHDTERFLTSCENNIKKFKLATVFQFTYVGVPYIFYGDEVGLKGENDPHCRKCMAWDEKEQDKNLFEHYKKLIKMRKENEELILGSYECILCDEFKLAFKRKFKDSETLVFINNEDREFCFSLETDKKYKDLYSNKILNGDNFFKMPPMSFKILKVL